MGEIIEWSPFETNVTLPSENPIPNWNTYPTEAGLAHEIRHAVDWALYRRPHIQEHGIIKENSARYQFYLCVPGYGWVYPRPLTGNKDLGSTAEKAWYKWWKGFPYGPFYK